MRMQRNKDPPVSYEGQYSTDVIAPKAYEFLEEEIYQDKLYFRIIASTAPHSNVNIKSNIIDGNLPRASSDLVSPFTGRRTPAPFSRHHNSTPTGFQHR
jgi:N-acetylglucosamine-6-sulfatase